MPRVGRSIEKLLSGQKPGIQLPNFILRMVPTSKELNPDRVAFRVPMTFNKLMIRNALEQLYNVNVCSASRPSPSPHTLSPPLPVALPLQRLNL